MKPTTDTYVDRPELADYSVRLGYRLRDLRRERGLSQESVAQRAHIALYTYQKFEKGESKPGTPMNPTLNTLLSLAWVFDLDVTELLDFDGRTARSDTVGEKGGATP